MGLTPFHCLAYTVNGGVNDANVDMTAATDPSFSIRNGHFIFTEEYECFGALALGTSLLRARIFAPTINAISPHHIWGVNRAVTIPSPPAFEDLRSYPLLLPRNEEVQVQESNNLGVGNEQETAFLLIQPKGRTRQIPDGLRRLTVRATATATRTANAWGTDSAITFEQGLRAGYYSVVGVECFEAATQAFRLNFVRMPLVNGRKLFPAGIALQAVGNIPVVYDRGWAGWWGTFHTFEQPLLSVFSTGAGAGSEELRLDLVFHGDNPPADSIASHTY